MKKVLLLLIVLLQISISAQDIMPIPADTTSIWRIERQYNDEVCVYHDNSFYYIDGTQIINGNEYYRVLENGYHWETSVHPMDPCNGSSYTYSGRFRGYIRTVNGKVYGSTANNSGLLLDFTLNVGDTMYSSICEYGKVIESIDSVLIGDNYRKKFNFENSWYCSWMIEGIGHARGLFESMDEPFESESWFKCYGENGVSLLGNGDCNFYVNQNEISDFNSQIEVFPIPTLNTLFVKKQNSNIEIDNYRILSSYGGEISLDKNRLRDKNEIEINLEKLNPGIYILVLELKNNERVVKKIVKQ